MGPEVFVRPTLYCRQELARINPRCSTDLIDPKKVHPSKEIVLSKSFDERINAGPSIRWNGRSIWFAIRGIW